jgi:hypothetical protein
MAPDSRLLEIYSTRLYLALSTECSRPTFPPSLPRWAGSRPLPLHAAPAYWPFLCTEAGSAINTSPVAIRVVAAVNGLEDFCSSVSAIWTTHPYIPPFGGPGSLYPMRETSAVGLQFRRGAVCGGGLPKVEPKELIRFLSPLCLRTSTDASLIKRQEKLFA